MGRAADDDDDDDGNNNDAAKCEGKGGEGGGLLSVIDCLSDYCNIAALGNSGYT